MSKPYDNPNGVVHISDEPASYFTRRAWEHAETMQNLREQSESALNVEIAGDEKLLDNLPNLNL